MGKSQAVQAAQPRVRQGRAFVRGGMSESRRGTQMCALSASGLTTICNTQRSTQQYSILNQNKKVH